MRRTLILLSAVAAFGAMVPSAQAQSNPTRSDTIPGNQPIDAYSAPHRDYMRTYVRGRPMSEFGAQTAVGVSGSAQSSAQTSATSAAGANNGGNIALGANVPSSVQLRSMQGSAEYSGYRYGRMGNQYVVVDSRGRILDMFE